MTMETEDKNWFGYECKSGQILFYYNKKTGEHRWPFGSDKNASDTTIKCEPVESNQVQSVGIQTEDNGCNNGCTSKYIDNSKLPDDLATSTTTGVETNCSKKAEEMDPDWFGYECKSGQILFYYNKTTGEHRWAGGSDEQKSILTPARGEQLQSGVLLSIGTQTDDDDDDDCSNGCTSIYINKDDSSVIDSTMIDSTMTDDQDVDDQDSQHISVCSESDEAETSHDEMDISHNDSPLADGSNISSSTHANKHSKESNNVIELTGGEETSEGQNTQNDKGFPCKLCKVCLETTDEYYSHLKTHCSETSSECPVCKKVLRKKNYLFSHLKNHSEETSHKLQKRKEVKANICKYCHKSYKQPGILREHERIHTGIRPYKCKQCNKAFRQAGTLISHKRTHLGVKLFKCAQCNKAYTQPGALKLHLRSHSNEKPYKCTQCSKAFKNSTDLKRHEPSHSEIRPYKCTECDKAFHHLYGLKVHKRIHSGIRPYACTQCERTFINATDLKQHNYIHTNERPYKCEYCNKAFNHSSYLKDHKRLHSNLKPYKCTECDKAFKLRGRLRRHKISHSNVKPFKCTLCTKAFKMPDLLKRHQLSHSDVKPYKCIPCNKAYKIPYALKRHQRSLLHSNSISNHVNGGNFIENVNDGILFKSSMTQTTSE